MLEHWLGLPVWVWMSIQIWTFIFIGIPFLLTYLFNTDDKDENIRG